MKQLLKNCTWCGDGTRADVSSIFIIFRLAIDCEISRSFFGTFIAKCGDGVCDRKSLEADLKYKKNAFLSK